MTSKSLRHHLVFLLLAALVPITSGPAPARAGVVGPALSAVSAGDPDAPVTVWVTFTDRAGAERDPAAIAAARARMTPRALERRRLRGTLKDVVASDLPVHEPYVRALAARGAELRGTSRWLNAASIRISAREATQLARLPFVSGVELVPVGRVSRDPEPFVADRPGAGASARSGTAPEVQLAPGDTVFYGATFKQMNLMQVPRMHAAGLSGAGVLVCMLDGGFRTTHQIFAGLNIVATRDFVNNDLVVDDQVPPDSVGEASHGTATLACVAGFKAGTYIGAAYGCSVALGKTEYVPTETPVEMDHWQRGAEWADSLGADLISSSLGYFQFDSPNPSYTYADLDGQTTVVTRAASEAVRRGITVVTAAGNEGATPWHFLIAPADADTVLAIGAVDSFNVVTAFSSRGPSADGRIKPDVTAMGLRVYLPSFTNAAGYGRASGTSFATPLTAGVVALLLEAHPTWGPFEVREALRETALNHAAPNNDSGWGLVQGFAASEWSPSTTAIDPPEGGDSAGQVALAAGPNPFRAGHSQIVRLRARGRVALDLFDVRGRRVSRLFEGVVDGAAACSWNGSGDDGRLLPAGMYWIRLSAAPLAGAAIPPAAAVPSALRVVLLP
jgi:subtilisin family serine protease